MWVTKSKSFQKRALELRPCRMFQTSWRRTQSTRLFHRCACQPEELVHAAPTLSEDRESHSASVCSLLKQRGVWDRDTRSRLSPQIDASLSGTLQSFSRGFPPFSRASVGIMKEPKCLLLFMTFEWGMEHVRPFAWCLMQPNVRRATILNQKGAKISLVMSSAVKCLTGLKEPFSPLWNT